MPAEVSVVLPVFNALSGHLDYLPGAIASVLAQSQGNFELIIIDDGSTEDYTKLRAQFNDPRIKWARQENAGQSVARNHGASIAHGEYLAFIDQDDQWYPEFLAICLAEIADGTSAFVYCDVDRMNEAGTMDHPAFFRTTKRGTHPKTSLAQVIGQDCFVMPSAMLMRRSVFLELGGFDESLAGCEDDDLFRRFYLSHNCRFIPTPLLRWSSTGVSASFSPRMDTSRLRYFHILERAHPEHLHALIAPRFFWLFSGIYRQGAAVGNAERMALARQGLHALQPYLSRAAAVAASLLLALPQPVFVPWQKLAHHSRLYAATRLLVRRK